MTHDRSAGTSARVRPTDSGRRLSADAATWLGFVHVTTAVIDAKAAHIAAPASSYQNRSQYAATIG
jgi:hypothetical protein